MARDELKLPGDEERERGRVSPAWQAMRWVAAIVGVYLIVDGIIGLTT